MSRKPKIEYGGYGKMPQCQECGWMPNNFCIRRSNFVICPKCGSRQIKIVIARPRTVKSGFFRIEHYLKPQVRKSND